LSAFRRGHPVASPSTLRSARHIRGVLVQPNLTDQILSEVDGVGAGYQVHVDPDAELVSPDSRPRCDRTARRVVDHREP